MLSIRSFADADCSKLLSEQAAVVFKIEHPGLRPGSSSTLMYKQVTAQERQEIVRRCLARDASGDWAEGYRQIAHAFSVSETFVSQTAHRAGVALRNRNPKRRLPVEKIAKTPYRPPPQLQELYDKLKGRVGKSSAQRLLEEYMRVRGI